MLIIHEQLRQGGTFSTAQCVIYSVLASCYSTKFNTAQRRAVLSPRGLKWINRSSECNYLLISFACFLPQSKVQICIQPACLFCADKESNMAFTLYERNSIHHGFCAVGVLYDLKSGRSLANYVAMKWDIWGWKYGHHHHVPEGLGVFPVPRFSRWSWSLHLFLGRPMFLRPFGLYCSACFGSLFVSILCTCYSHFSWYCFISFTVFRIPVFCLIHWFFSLSSFVIPISVSKNFICCFWTLFLSFLQYPSFTSKFRCCFSCNVVKIWYPF